MGTFRYDEICHPAERSGGDPISERRSLYRVGRVPWAPIEMGKAEVLEKGKEIAILAVGNMVRTAVQVTENLRKKGYEPTLVNMRFVKPLDTELLDIIKEDHSLIVTMEENVKSGGFGEQVMTYYGSRMHGPAVRIVAIEDRFVPHGSVEDLMRQQQMDSDSVTERCFSGRRK